MCTPCIPGRWSPGPQGTACECRWKGQSDRHEQSFGALPAQQGQRKQTQQEKQEQRRQRQRCCKGHPLHVLETPSPYMCHVCLVPGSEAQRPDRRHQGVAACGFERLQHLPAAGIAIICCEFTFACKIEVKPQPSAAKGKCFQAGPTENVGTADITAEGCGGVADGQGRLRRCSFVVITCMICLIHDVFVLHTGQDSTEADCCEEEQTEALCNGDSRGSIPE